MNLLFVHQGFPGQYIHVLRALAGQGHQIVGLGMTESSSAIPNGIQYFKYGTSQSARITPLGTRHRRK